VSDVRDVIIIGSGPSGLTAAIYAARANLRPLCIEGVEAGGQLMLTTDVENYPGFPEGIMGPDMMARFREQAERFGTEFLTADVDRVDFSEQPFGVFVDEHEYRARTVLVSTGAKARMLGIESEQRLLGHGVSTCATCDGFFFRDQHIAVVGGGDSAMEEATFLTKFASKVTVVHRRDELRASKIMQERALANDRIDFVWNSTVEEVLGDGTVEGVRLHDLVTGERSELPVTGLFLAIGHDPNTTLFRDQLDLDAQGYVLVHDGTHTSVDGVFACGDVVDHTYRQAITAAGTGCMAAIDAERWLEARAHAEHAAATSS
jgi:thioredoxin reductase (NADPH)